MANVIRIPLAVNLPWYAFDITLEQVGYHVEMAYQTRRDRWCLTLADAAKQTLLESLPVLIDRNLLRAYQHLAVPRGMLICIDTTGKQQQPTLGSFLTTHALYYMESGF